MKKLLAILLAFALMLPCALAEDVSIPFYSTYAVAVDDNAWLEIPNEYDMYLIPASYTLAYVIHPTDVSKLCVSAHVPEGHVFQADDMDASGFVENEREVMAGADITEASTVIERYEIDDLPAARVDMTGQGYEMIWIDDSADLYFFMYPATNEAFAQTMRDVADSFHLSAAKTPADCTPEDYTYTVDAQGVTITGYVGNRQRVRVPEEIGGLPVVALAENAFYEASVTGVELPDSIVRIGASCFGGCALLQTLRLPAGLKEIPEGMLESCMRLQELTIPDTVTSIGQGAFWGNMFLAELTLPAALETIEPMNFVMAFCLERFSVAEGNTHFVTQEDGGVLLSADGKRFLHYCPWQSRQRYAVPDGVESIDSFAFIDFGDLTEVILPDGVITVGAAAFLSANALTRLTIPASAVALGTDADGGTAQIAANAVIVAPEGSAAQQYAEKFGHTFESAPAETQQSESSTNQ